MYTQIEDRFFAGILDGLVNLTLNLVDDLFNPGRMNTTITNKTLKSIFCHGPANRIKR